MQMLRNVLVVLFVVGAFCLSAATEARAQGAQDFTVVNKTGVEINALYVTPHNAKDWGEDILGADTLPVNEELDITFAPKERAKLWDLRVEDEDGGGSRAQAVQHPGGSRHRSGRARRI